MKFFIALVCLLYSPYLFAENTSDSPKVKLLLIGNMPSNTISNLQKSKYKLSVKNETLTNYMLSDFSAIIIGHCDKSLSEDEINALVGFAEYGHTVIIAGQAWSLNHKAYGGIPNELIPINRLGARFGFNVQSKYAGAPAEINSTSLPSVESIDMKGGVTSPITSMSEFESILRDSNGNNVGIQLKQFSGKVFVFGHELILGSDNVIKDCLSDLR